MTNSMRALYGFVFGLIFMLACVAVFHVNEYDYTNMKHGVQALWQGVNPWRPETRLMDFYNPPFAMLFMWPMLYATTRAALVLGGALLFALAFHQRAWVALAWFAANSFLFFLSTGGIDMVVVGGGLLLLFAGDHYFAHKRGLLLRVLGYGLLLVKPQGTIFIVALYILTRRDWRGALVSLLFYGLPFAWLFPDWLRVVLLDPPTYQVMEAQTIFRKFGVVAAAVAVVLALLARRWRYWQLGAVLAQTVLPYGMPAVPLLIIFTAIPKLVAIPVIVLFSAAIAAMTWLNPPPSFTNTYDFILPMLSIYHITMLVFGLALACLFSPEDADEPTDIDLSRYLRHTVSRARQPLKPTR